MKKHGNPIIHHKFTSDPATLVHQGKVYLYTEHDQTAIGQYDYDMREWLCFSSTDMLTWQEYPAPLCAHDFQWSAGGAFASHVKFRDGKFHWFISTKEKRTGGTAIGLASSIYPEKRFKDSLGLPLISFLDIPPTENKKANLDPSVLIDDDGSTYIFLGNKNCYYAHLNAQWTGLSSEIRLVETLPHFEEGSHIHKRDGWYYLCYGYGMPEKVAYAMSRSVHGPWEFKGIINEIAGNCQTNRPCIVDFKDRSYFLYHNGALKNGGSFNRSVCAENLYYNSDGTIRRIVMSSEGIDIR